MNQKQKFHQKNKNIIIIIIPFSFNLCPFLVRVHAAQAFVLRLDAAKAFLAARGRLLRARS